MNDHELNLIQNILADDFEVEMSYEGDIFPMPKFDEYEKKPDRMELNRCEADSLFGDLIFERTPDGHFIYNGVQLRAHIVDILKLQNQLQNNVFFDKKFIFMLMLELFDVNDMMEQRLDPLKRSIIQGCFLFYHQYVPQ